MFVPLLLTSPPDTPPTSPTTPGTGMGADMAVVFYGRSIKFISRVRLEPKHPHALLMPRTC